MPDESTTPGPEEVVRQSLEAFDHSDLDAVLTFAAPNAVWDWSPVGLGIYQGREAIRGVFQDWRDSYEDMEQALEQFHDVGNGVTFGVVRQHARLSGSSGFLEVRYGAVYTWLDGPVECITASLEPDEARAAAERLAQERG